MALGATGPELIEVGVVKLEVFLEISVSKISLVFKRGPQPRQQNILCQFGSPSLLPRRRRPPRRRSRRPTWPIRVSPTSGCGTRASGLRRGRRRCPGCSWVQTARCQESVLSLARILEPGENVESCRSRKETGQWIDVRHRSYGH